MYFFKQRELTIYIIPNDESGSTQILLEVFLKLKIFFELEEFLLISRSDIFVLKMEIEKLRIRISYSQPLF